MDLNTLSTGAIILLVFIYAAATSKMSAFGVSFGILLAGMIAYFVINKFIFNFSNLLLGIFTAGFYFPYFLAPAIKFKEYNEGIIAMLIVLFLAGIGLGFQNTSSIPWQSIALSSILGLGVGVSSLGFTNFPKDSKFMFSFGNTSNTKYSLIPGKQLFRCDVYRNGKLISQQ